MLLKRAALAVFRARREIAAVALLYALTVLIGAVMVNTGNRFAIERRDSIVTAARSSSSLVLDKQGKHVQAALRDFADNLVLGGLTSSIIGISVVGAVPIIAYRGWVGGIVSVDSMHRSRLRSFRDALYYCVTMLLQLIPYSIAGGVGVRLGIASWRAIGATRKTWFTLPREELLDAGFAYVFIAPLFLIASLWEFLAPRG